MRCVRQFTDLADRRYFSLHQHVGEKLAPASPSISTRNNIPTASSDACSLRLSLRIRIKKCVTCFIVPQHHCTAPGAVTPLLASCFIWEDAMSQEQIEREWFRKIVTVLLLGLLTFGAVPIVKNTFFPAEKSRR
jgi:hypothetical protein